MECRINIPANGSVHVYYLLPYGDFQVIDVDGVLYLRITKYHDHRYVLEGFIYRTKHIVSYREFDGKKKLYGTIQKLLQEKL